MSNIWIKFEGGQNGNVMPELHDVHTIDGKKIYILNYSKRPSKVENGDSVFMAEGLKDSFGKPYQAITGRGHLCAFSEGSECPTEWIKKYSWMEHYKYYVVIKDFEMLNVKKFRGLRLEKVINNVGTETYEASSGKERDKNYLMHIHTRRMHMILTPLAEAFINQEFDKLVEQYGSTKYYSEI